MKKLLLIISIHFFVSSLYSQRLILSEEELSEKKCQIVANYFQYLKHVKVVSSKAYEPFIRNANSIALDRLLHRQFTTTDFGGGNRDLFIKNLEERTNTNTLLKKKFTVFDCPNFDFISTVTDDAGVADELEDMDIIDLNIKTTKYKGWMLFAEEEYSSYNIKKSWVARSGTGISKNAKVKKLHYEIYPLDSNNVVLKIRRIENVNKVETVTQKDSTGYKVVKYKKVKPENFTPCCDQPKPDDNDSDGYNVLVDCDDGNANINPGAQEIIADGIDQNCDGEDQLGEDGDGDGYYYSACFHPDPEVRKKCDCNDDDPDVFYRDSLVPESKWYFSSNGWNDDNCDCIKDKPFDIPWVDLSWQDYLIPGIGHFKRGKTRFSRDGLAYLYGGFFLASTTFSIYSKVQSNKFYSRHIGSETFRLAKVNLANADRHNKSFLVSAGISALLYATNAAHISIKDTNQRILRQEAIDEEIERKVDSDFCYQAKIGVSQNDFGLGIGLFINFN